MSVVASGGLYQWVHNGVDIPGANASSYTIVNMQAADAGQYTVRVYNSLGSTNCPAVTITYVADTTPPTLLTAIGNTNLTIVTVTFSEPITIDATFLNDAPFNFTLTDLDDAMAMPSFSAAGSPNNTTLVLTNDTALDPSHRYTLKVVGGYVTDCAGNQTPETTVPVNSIRSTLLKFQDSWKYLDSDVDPGPDWFQPGYNDAGWVSGAGPFDAKRNGDYPTTPSNCRSNTFYALYDDPAQIPVPTCIALTSPVTGTNQITHNFRTHFTFGGSPAGAILELHGKFDDGAVVYLNGTEVNRTRMPAAPAVITRASLATATVNDGDAQDVIPLVRPASLLNGDNVLAVELHQVNLTSSDSTMGLKVVAVTTGPLAPPLRLTIVLNPDGSVTVSWPGGGTLICTTDPTLPRSSWTAVAGAVSPHTFAAGTLAAHRFYAVRVP